MALLKYQNIKSTNNTKKYHNLLHSTPSDDKKTNINSCISKHLILCNLTYYTLFYLKPKKFKLLRFVNNDRYTVYNFLWDDLFIKYVECKYFNGRLAA